MPPAGHRQTMLFSATFPKEIQRLAADFLHDYIFLTVGRVGSSTDLIAQHVEYMQGDQKKETVLDCVNTVEVRAVVGARGLECAAGMRCWGVRSVEVRGGGKQEAAASAPPPGAPLPHAPAPPVQPPSRPR